MCNPNRTKAILKGVTRTEACGHARWVWPLTSTQVPERSRGEGKESTNAIEWRANTPIVMTPDAKGCRFRACAKRLLPGTRNGCRQARESAGRYYKRQRRRPRARDNGMRCNVGPEKERQPTSRSLHFFSPWRASGHTNNTKNEHQRKHVTRIFNSVYNTVHFSSAWRRSRGDRAVSEQRSPLSIQPEAQSRQ